MFEDVLPFKLEVVQKVYQMLKEAYVDKNPVIMQAYFSVKPEKLNAIYRYVDDFYELQKYYQDLDTYVPQYHFLKTEKNKLIVGIEFKDHSLTVFPPHLDYVFYRINQEIKVYSANEVIEVIEKFLLDVPGFIKGTKVIPKKFVKKAHKAIKKHTFEKVSHMFEKADFKYLIDI
jgi:hypothetical protein